MLVNTGGEQWNGFLWLLQFENLYIKETKSLSFASLKSAPLAIVFRILPQTSQLAMRLWSSPGIAGPWKVADINLRGNQRLPSLLPTLEKKSYSGQGGHRAQRLPTCLFVLLTPFDPGPEFCRLPRFCAEYCRWLGWPAESQTIKVHVPLHTFSQYYSILE